MNFHHKGIGMGSIVNRITWALYFLTGLGGVLGINLIWEKGIKIRVGACPFWSYLAAWVLIFYGAVKWNYCILSDGMQYRKQMC